MEGKKLKAILKYLETNNNIDIVYDLIIKKDIQMFKYIDCEEYRKFKKDLKDAAIEEATDNLMEKIKNYNDHKLWWMFGIERENDYDNYDYKCWECNKEIKIGDKYLAIFKAEPDTCEINVNDYILYVCQECYKKGGK